MSSCSLGNLQDLVKDKEKALVIFTEPHCPHGDSMKDLLKKNVGKFEEKKLTVIVIEANLDDKECMGMLRNLNVQACPTTLFYEKGKEVGRFIPAGQTQEEVLNKLLDFKP